MGWLDTDESRQEHRRNQRRLAKVDDAVVIGSSRSLCLAGYAYCLLGPTYTRSAWYGDPALPLFSYTMYQAAQRTDLVDLDADGLAALYAEHWQDVLTDVTLPPAFAEVVGPAGAQYTGALLLEAIGREMLDPYTSFVEALAEEARAWRAADSLVDAEDSGSVADESGSGSGSGSESDSEDFETFGSEYGDFDDGSDGRGEHVEGSGTQSTPAPPLLPPGTRPRCDICMSKIKEVDESLYQCRVDALFVHRTCGDKVMACARCRKPFELVDRQGRLLRKPEVNLDVTTSGWDESFQVSQNATQTLCYAAAAATAIGWSRKRKCSLSEAIHLFACSGEADADTFVEYRRVYEALEEQLAKANERSTPPAVHKKMATTNLRELGAVMAQQGSPVFPTDVTHELLVSKAASWEVVTQAIRGGKLVLMGSGDHWMVAYGFMGSADGSIRRIRFYDPKSDSSLVLPFVTADATYVVA
ncbi:hypothetical protein [Streptomyces sp. NPDC059918]|uniref:hypothetical protein n=1 Tax=unclassified Streptomyces TaxID=2593676 RepID=UPI0036548527